MENEIETCPFCGGPGLFLGDLGSTTHYRCRGCGMVFGYSEPEPEPEPPRKRITEIAKERGWDEIPDHVETAYKTAIRGMNATIGIVESAGGEDEMMMGGGS